MDVGLAIESDVAVSHLIPSVRGINNALEAYFLSRSYGADLTGISIGVILVGTSEISDRFHPIRPFRYKRFDRKKSRITGEIYEIKTAASWDVKPDFVKFRGVDLIGARNYICESLIASISFLGEHSSKFPDFDVGRFRVDFESCLEGHCI
jgi:hypothetical protein